MTDIRARLAEALMDGVGADERDAYQAVDVLLTWPRIAVIFCVGVRVKSSYETFTPTEARAFAAAVLAAVDAIERPAK